MRLRILIADDHDLVRRGLRAVLESQSGWKVCAEASDGQQAVEEARKHKPDVAVLDISMPELNGIEAARRIRKELPRTQVIIVTVHEEDELARELLQLGVLGYLLKSDADKDLVPAVQAVSQGKPFLTPKVSQAVLEGYLQPQRATSRAPKSRLTPREREIVQLLAEGRSNKEVADRLNISVKTAETHRANIMRKLQLASFSELVRYAIRNKIIPP
jgi:DNA-binding NarL/FixJ family response regulator